MIVCSVPGCLASLGPGGAGGLCPRHYKAKSRGRPLVAAPGRAAHGDGMAETLVIRCSTELRARLEAVAGPEYAEWVREAIRMRLMLLKKKRRAR